MRTHTNTTALVLGFCLFALAFLIVKGTLPVSASVVAGNEHIATTTYAGAATPRTLKASYGALAQVTITGANTGLMTFYDATTSDVTLRNNVATSSLLMLADFPASAAAGTYTFDATFSKGLLLVTSGNVATSTITYR